MRVRVRPLCRQRPPFNTHDAVGENFPYVRQAVSDQWNLLVLPNQHCCHTKQGRELCSCFYAFLSFFFAAWLPNQPPGWAVRTLSSGMAFDVSFMSKRTKMNSNQTAYLKFCHIFSIKMTSGVWLGHSGTKIFTLGPTVLEQMVSFRALRPKILMETEVEGETIVDEGAKKKSSIKVQLYSAL